MSLLLLFTKTVVSGGTITLVSTSQFLGDTGTVTVTNNVPTGTIDGDFMVWTVTCTNATSPTTPSGWTALSTQSTTQCQMATFYRFASSEPANYSMTVVTSRYTGEIITYRGVDPTTPLDVAAVSSLGTTPVTLPAITPVTANAWVLGYSAIQTANAITNTTWSTTNMDAIDIYGTSPAAAATNSSAAMSHLAWTSGTITPTLSATGTNSRFVSITAALRPAPAVSDTAFVGWGVPL